MSGSTSLPISYLGKFFKKNLQVCAKKLHAITNKLQVCTKELHVSTNKLQVCTKKLHVSTNKLQVRTKELRNRTKKFHPLFFSYFLQFSMFSYAYVISAFFY